MTIKRTVLLAVLSLSLAGCTLSGSSDQANNCSILDDKYFTFLPTSNQTEDPHGYFSEVVEAQNAFIRKLEGLPSTSTQENTLIGDLVTANRKLESAYSQQLESLSVGQTRDEFLRGLSEAEFEAWVADGEELASVTQRATLVFEDYAAFCSSEG